MNRNGNGGEESLLQWFDRNVEKELKKRRDVSINGSPILPGLPVLTSPLIMGRELGEKIAETSASHIEIAGKLKGALDTQLEDAVDKLATAEAICEFTKALEAAETAAQGAPANMVEEFALQGAKEFHTEVTGRVNGMVPGEKPIEVIGYVGVTKPKYPKYSK